MSQSETLVDGRRAIHHRVTLYIMGGFIFHLPFSFSHELSFLLYRIIIAMLAVNWLAAKHYRRIPILTGNTAFLAFAGFYFLHIAGLTYTANLDTGFFQLEKKAALLLFPLVLATSDKFTQKDIKRLFNVFVLSVITACFICLTYAFYRNAQPQIHGINWLYFTYHDFTDILSIQPNYLAIYVSFSILILIDVLSRTSLSPGKRALHILLILTFVIFLVLLSGRTQIAALFVVISIGTIIFFYRRRMLLKGLVVIGIFTLILFSLIIQVPVVKERFYAAMGVDAKQEWIHLYGDGSQLKDVRLMKWKCSLNIIADHWLIGVGTGDVQDELQEQYKKTNFKVAFESQFNAHNQFLQTGIGLGIIGLISLCCCIAVPAITAVKQRNELFTAFLVFFAICCLTESIFERQFGIVFYAIFVSLFTFSSKSQKSH